MNFYRICILPAFIAAVMSLCSCEIETSGNGELDGMWHLVSVDTLATSGVRDMTSDRIYWSFQNKLLELDDKTGANNSVLYRFEFSDGTLKLYDPYIYDRENGDKPFTNIIMLSPFGVNELEEDFTVESFSGSKMILRSDELRLKFRKM